MERIQNFEARSADVIINDDIAIISFLTAIEGQPNAAVSMRVDVLARLQSRISRALDALPKHAPSR